MRTVQKILGEMEGYLERRQIPAPKRQAEELLGAALGLARLDLYLNFERPLIESELKQCRDYLKRAGEGEPLAYLLGEVSFYDVELSVDPRVLIPRPETELMVESIACELKGRPLKGKTLWDLCTGSGCIGLALKKALPDLHVICSDICPHALDVARRNAEKNGLDVTFYQEDFLNAYDQPVDYLVTNPPYVTEAEYETLSPSVHREPKQALLGGLTFYQRLAQRPPLVSGGRMWIEIGSTQGEAVKKLFSNPPFVHLALSQDLAGLDRSISVEVQGEFGYGSWRICSPG